MERYIREYYLQHRYSEDLDFFSESKFDNEVILALMSDWSEKYGYKFTSRFAEVVYRFDINFKDGENFKVDFGFYPYKQVEKGLISDGIVVDSLRDIATNKLSVINQRIDIKDFVDLYIILQDHYTVWDFF